MNKKQQETKHVPMRTCIVTRKRMPKNKLARFVLNSEDNKVYLDDKARLSNGQGKIRGRGANITFSLETFDKAVEIGAFDRAFKMKIASKELKELRGQFEDLIEKREFREGKDKVTVRVKSDKIQLD